MNYSAFRLPWSKSNFELKQEAKTKFLFDKCVTEEELEEIPIEKRESLNREFTEYLNSYKKKCIMEIVHLRKKNNEKLLSLSLEKQFEVFNFYCDGQEYKDFIIGGMHYDGLIFISYKKCGKVFGKIKGAELSVGSVPMKINYRFGAISNEIFADIINIKKYYEEYVYESIYYNLRELISKVKENL